MCEPVTLGIAAGAIVAGTAVKAYAGYQEGQAQAEQLRAQRDLERRAEIDSVERGAAEAGRARSAGTEAVAENRVALAGAGVDVQSGTALDILADTRAQSELEVETIRNNARREAWGHKVQAQQLDFARKNAKRMSYLGVASTFLGGAAQGAQVYGGSR